MTKNQKVKKYFNQKEKLTLKNRVYLKQVKFFTEFFLEEDLSRQGDITTDLLIKQNKKVRAKIMAKESGILAGMEEARWFLKKNKLQIIPMRIGTSPAGSAKHKKDGDKIKKGDVLMSVSGGIKDILKTERTALNLLQRMSGIATQTDKLVRKTKNKALVCATRKTQWGLLDKKAVAVGGGGTHRLGLYDFIMIKDNHISMINDQRTMINDLNSFWEIEADTPSQAIKFSKLNPSAILLDNFRPETIKKIIKKLNPEIIFEASGGINEDTISKYAKSGVDIISVGALTHSSKALDIGLEIQQPLR